MAKTNGGSLFFDEHDVKEPKPLLIRAFRAIFYAIGVTQDSYVENYHTWMCNGLKSPPTHKEFNAKCTADRRTFVNPEKMTIKTFTHALDTQGYDVEAMSFRVRHRLTGEVLEVSSEDLPKDLEAARMARNNGSIDSLV